MSSTFYGLNIAKSGLVASQIAINVTSNNVANVGTEGYTRQGVDQSSISPTTGTHRFASTAKESGKGVSVDGISQYRDQFLDLRYRNANSTSSTYATNLGVLDSISGIVDETKNDGLIVSLQDYYTSLQDLSANKDDVSFSSLTRSAAKTVVGMLNQYSQQLQELEAEQKSDMEITLDSVNSLIQKIDALNTNIRINIRNGTDSNELLDSRNYYLDELSSYMNIDIEENSNGTVSVLCDSAYLLDAQNDTITTLSMDTSTDTVKVVDGGGNEFSVSGGAIKGILQGANGLGSYAATGEDSSYGIAYYQVALDELASRFADTFNNLNGTSASLFVSSDLGSITAASISISDDWRADAELIDTDYATDMISALKGDTSYTSGFTGTFEEFATELMSGVATDISYADDMAGTYSSIVSTIEDERQAISGVSTDEEAINTIKFQKAYQAAARVMTALDELLDTLINGTGLVGR